MLTAYACASVANGLPWPLLLALVWGEYAGNPYGAWLLGLAGAARMAPYVLLSWAVASLGDHVRRDLLVRTTLALRVLFLGMTALAVGADRIVLAVVCAALAVAVGTPTYPAIGASIPRLAGAGRARATDLLVTIEVSSWVVGPAIGGLLLATPLRGQAPVAAVALAALAYVLVRDVAMPAPEVRAPDAVRGMLRAIRRCRPAVVALAMAAVLNLVETAAGLAMLPLSHESWGRGEDGYGVAVACLGFGALGGPLVARVLRASYVRGLEVIAAAFTLVALSPLPWLVLPVLAVAGATGVAVESLVTGVLQRVVPDCYRAGALGLADAVMVGSCLVGSLLAPVLAASIGARGVLLLAAGVAGVPVALAYRTAPPGRRRDMPIAHDPTPGFSNALVLDNATARSVASFHDQAAAAFATKSSAPGGDLGEGGACIEAITERVDEVCQEFATAAQELALQVEYATQGLRQLDDAIRENVGEIQDSLR